MAWEATMQWTSALNRWQQRDARKSVSLWTREHSRNSSGDSCWGLGHHNNSQYLPWIFSSSWAIFRNELCICSFLIWFKPFRRNVQVLSGTWIQIQIYSLRWSFRSAPFSYYSWYASLHNCRFYFFSPGNSCLALGNIFVCSYLSTVFLKSKYSSCFFLCDIYFLSYPDETGASRWRVTLVCCCWH